MLRRTPTALPEHRFPVEPWRLVETSFDGSDSGLTETLFAIGNGYLGMRANPSEGREAHTHGTYLNGFHETWTIKHAEDAFAFAKTGQTIVNAPDAKLMKLYVDDEPLLLADAELEHYERVLDMAAGRSWRDLIWRTPAGKRIHVRSERLISFEHRHLAVLTFEVTLLDSSAPVVISSQLLNRQDGEDEYHVADAALGEGRDPRKANRFEHRVLIPKLQHHEQEDPGGGRVTLGYRCANSGMTVAVAYDHEIETPCEYEVETTVAHDLAKTVYSVEAEPGQTIRLTKFVSYHSSTGVPCQELADRCHRTIVRARAEGTVAIEAEQRRWMDSFWASSDVEISGDERAQRAIRWNLYQLAQATARTQEQGVAAKGVTAGGYDGHYFWDTEVYVIPYLAYTDPEVARKLLRFRWRMLPAARKRAEEMSEQGALYPWRTINGEEASAYYAAGTAQYHINAAVVYALERYLFATGDVDFLAEEGAEMLVETARMWRALGFFAGDGKFHIHRVTGPDEYTTVVNDNFYTNVMARFNLSYAVQAVRLLLEFDPEAFNSLCRSTSLDIDEIATWERAAGQMYLPFDERLGINPQDDAFLELESWDFADTPDEKYPLLLNFHPLVIYRHQVLKQADVVLAMHLRGHRFARDQKKANFDYYDPITTGDSSLSACVQSIVAAEVGEAELAFDYFEQALYLDLSDTHGNTSDGVHIASAGGVWAAIVHGFAGLVDNGEHLRFSPRLPVQWRRVRFPLRRHGCRLLVDVDHDGATVSVVDGPRVPVAVGDEIVELAEGESVRIGVDGDRSPS